jgi:hypothetical protein
MLTIAVLSPQSDLPLFISSLRINIYIYCYALHRMRPMLCSDGVNVMPIKVVVSIDPELLENFIDMEKFYVSVDNCMDES